MSDRLTENKLRHIMGNPHATTGRKTLDAIIGELLALRALLPHADKLACLEGDSDPCDCGVPECNAYRHARRAYSEAFGG